MIFDKDRYAFYVSSGVFRHPLADGAPRGEYY